VSTTITSISGPGLHVDGYNRPHVTLRIQQIIMYLAWEVLDQLPTALQYLITYN